MSCDNNLEFEKILADIEKNDIIVTLIKDNAFDVDFLASCIAHYYATILCKENSDA